MKVPKIFLSRLFDYGLLIILQLIWWFLVYSQVLEIVSWLNYVLEILSIFVVLWLVNKEENPSYKISWIILILIFPILGGFLYLLIGNK
ncbi:MAG: PLDc N-terminal domain-containing protein, partial [Erysipelotrichaceae bacterium]|nr:PLDc N-terminal domain-containing protein [Erysipelotrichaceae bacterium]